jgi:PBP1b-binding outer membrane lipoprotein LpoB
MKKGIILKSLFVVGTIAFLSGCMEEEAKTREYYQAHLDEAEAVKEKCKKLETFNAIEQIDCANANEAIFFGNPKKKRPSPSLTVVPDEK